MYPYAGSQFSETTGTLTGLDSDIQFGFTDASGNYTVAGSGVYPNTVKVTVFCLR